MTWIPGWDSIASTGWWSGFYFWASIGCLIGLGASEIASHRYSDRRDQLVEDQRIAEKKQHDDEMARGQHDTALVKERAATLEREAADLNLKAEQLKRRVGPRNLSDQAREALIEDLKPLGPMKYDLAEPETLEPGSWLTFELVKIFTTLGWKFQSYEGPSPKKPLPFLLETTIFPNSGRTATPQYFVGVESGLVGARIEFDFRFEAGHKAQIALINCLVDSGIPPASGAEHSGSEMFALTQTPISDVLHIEIGSK
jgi:hypothetical protein